MNTLAPTSRSKILDAALHVIRSKGYTAATVDDICAAAGVTKGSFFHHFTGKLDLALAAIEYWNTTTGQLFAGAPYQDITDPRDRVLAYIDFRKALIDGETPAFTCLLGTLVQETFDTHHAIRDACGEGIVGHAQDPCVVPLAEAKALYAPDGDWGCRTSGAVYPGRHSGRLHSRQGADTAADAARICVDQLRGHVASLLNCADIPTPSETNKPNPKRRTP